MVTPSRVGLNKARHLQGIISKKEQEDKERRIEEKRNEKPVNPEEHEKRLKILRKIGIIKGDKKDE